MNTSTHLCRLLKNSRPSGHCLIFVLHLFVAIQTEAGYGIVCVCVGVMHFVAGYSFLGCFWWCTYSAFEAYCRGEWPLGSRSCPH